MDVLVASAHEQETLAGGKDARREFLQFLVRVENLLDEARE